MSAPVRQTARTRRSWLSAERLLPLACLAGSLLLIASEFMTTFRFEAAGETVLELSQASDRHAWAMLVLGVFAILALAFAIRTGSKPAAIAVAAAGITAVLLFLILDLPDAGKVGTFDDEAQTFTQAEAMPEGGFWLTLIGALVLAVCGAALATLSSDQLRSLAGRFAASPPAGRAEARSTHEDSDARAAQERDGEEEGMPAEGVDTAPGADGRRRRTSLTRTQGGRRSERT